MHKVVNSSTSNLQRKKQSAGGLLPLACSTWLCISNGAGNLTHPPWQLPRPLSQQAASIQMAKRSFRFSKPVLWRRGRRKGCYSSRSLTPGEKRAVEIADGNITSNTFHIFFYTEFSLPKIVPLSHLMFFFVLVNSFLTWVKEAHSSSHERDPEPEISNSMSQLSALRYLIPILSYLLSCRDYFL